MPRKIGQKAKILELLHILEQKSDEDHRLSVPALLEMLEQAGVPAERKSIYTDLQALIDAGYDIELRRGRGGGYFLGDRAFQLAELKLLVDAVQSSRFITRRKSAELIHKLERLTSEHQAKQLHRQVFVSGRVKTMNESIYYTVDELHRAIAQNQQVRFQYYDWTPEKEKIARHDGAYYTASPWALAYENDNYYLIAYTGGGIRHYRVDKMLHLCALNARREGQREFEAFDLASYTRKMFGMYNGQATQVTLRCQNHLAGAILDRFGADAILVTGAQGAFTITAPVAVSPQFLGWVCGFGGEVEVLAPEDVRQQLAALASTLGRQYAP